MKSIPAECKVIIGDIGVAREKTQESLELPDVPAGKHTIVFEGAGKVLQKEISLDAGDEMRLMADFHGVVVTVERTQPGDAKAQTFSGMEFIEVPAGSFEMGKDGGDTGPPHQVSISKGFLMGKYEVTQAQWQALMGSNPSYFKGATLPVEQVSWNDCQEFIQKLNALGQGTYRLPSEAEWEYACRAGNTGEYCFGNDGSKIGEFAWHVWNCGAKTHDGGQKQPNTWGLYDMPGNVWEWCQDLYHESYTGAPAEGSAWELPGGGFRVLRGGSWYTYPQECRSAYRAYDPPDRRLNDIGFRLVRNP